MPATRIKHMYIIIPVTEDMELSPKNNEHINMTITNIKPPIRPEIREAFFLTFAFIIPQPSADIANARYERGRTNAPGFSRL